MRFAISLFLLLAVVTLRADDTPQARVIVIGVRSSAVSLSYTNGLSAVKAIAAAGGFTDFQKRAAFLVRCGRTRKLDINAMISGSQRDVILQAWDIILVEQ